MKKEKNNETRKIPIYKGLIVFAIIFLAMLVFLNNNYDIISYSIKGEPQAYSATSEEEYVLENETTYKIANDDTDEFEIITEENDDGAIFIDGKSGDDSNCGTNAEKPVKTFSVAKEKLEEKGYDTIYVVDTIQVEDEEHWDLDGKALKRYEKNTANLLINVSAGKLYLSNIIIDGGSEDNITVYNNYASESCGSLIRVSNNSYLEMNDGTSLQNNKNTWGTNYCYGAISARESEIVMNDGNIINNEAAMGAAISLMYDCKLTVNGGYIANNKLNQCTMTNSLDFSGRRHGGAIYTGEKCEIIINGGLIENNEATSGYGGAIYVHEGYETTKSTLTMNGGTIQKNTAGCGGGIYAECGSEVFILGGSILENVATGLYSLNNVQISATYAGGGIYINGGKNEKYGDAVLYLYNAVITENKATKSGGGVGACPTSTTKIYTNEGVAIYNNSAEEGAEDIYVTSDDSSNATGEISENMLGGGKNNWTYGKESDKEGELIPLENLKDFTEINAKNGANDGSIESAKNYAKVIISENSSGTSGGGIGSNGTIILGKQEEIQDLEVEKTWIDYKNADDTRPEEITVNLKVDETVIDSKTLSKDNDWKCTFEKLCTSYEYTIEETTIEGYTTEYENEYDEETGMLVRCKITNTYTANVDIPVNKIWEDYNNADNTRPESITVNLLRNGNKIDSKELTENDSWCYTFENLDKYDENNELYTYSITEETIENYNTEITGNQKDGYTITNTYTTTFDISGSKIWVDYENIYETRPDEITINLLKDGEEIDSQTTSESNNWSYLFENLEKYDSDGHEFVYTIEEEKVDGYITTYDENNNTINTLIDGRYVIVLVKQNEDGEFLSSVTFIINGDEKTTNADGIINIAEDKIICIKNVDIDDIYDISEKEALDGYKLFDGKISLTVTKKLATSGDKYIIDKAVLDETSENAENINISVDENKIIITVVNEKEEIITPEPDDGDDGNKANPDTPQTDVPDEENNNDNTTNKENENIENNVLNPKTGDIIIVLGSILLIAIAGLIVTIKIRKKLRNK